MTEDRLGPESENGTLLDRAHLARQTMGDSRLADELLAMLLGQVEALPGQMADAGPAQRAVLGHRMAGAAANLGAWPLAAAARAVAAGGEGDRDGNAAAGRLLAEAEALAALLRAGGATPAAVDEDGAEP